MPHEAPGRPYLPSPAELAQERLTSIPGPDDIRLDMVGGISGLGARAPRHAARSSEAAPVASTPAASAGEDHPIWGSDLTGAAEAGDEIGDQMRARVQARLAEVRGEARPQGGVNVGLRAPAADPYHSPDGYVGRRRGNPEASTTPPVSKGFFGRLLGRSGVEAPASDAPAQSVVEASAPDDEPVASSDEAASGGWPMEEGGLDTLRAVLADAQEAVAAARLSEAPLTAEDAAKHVGGILGGLRAAWARGRRNSAAPAEPAAEAVAGESAAAVAEPAEGEPVADVAADGEFITDEFAGADFEGNDADTGEYVYPAEDELVANDPDDAQDVSGPSPGGYKGRRRAADPERRSNLVKRFAVGAMVLGAVAVAVGLFGHQAVDHHQAITTAAQHWIPGKNGDPTIASNVAGAISKVTKVATGQQPAIPLPGNGPGSGSGGGQLLHDTVVKLGQYNANRGTGTVWNVVGDQATHILGGKHLTAGQQHDAVAQILKYNHIVDSNGNPDWDAATRLSSDFKVHMPPPEQMQKLLSDVIENSTTA